MNYVAYEEEGVYYTPVPLSQEMGPLLSLNPSPQGYTVGLSMEK